jgi:predicted hydrocarbon binding protein
MGGFKMSYSKDLIDQLQNLFNTFESDARYMRERIGELRDENEYLKKQIDVMLKVIGKDVNESRD